MQLQFELNQNQVSQMAQMLYLNLNDIQNYLDTHQKECQQLGIETKENVKKDNSIWSQYIDDTTCTIKANTNMKGND